MVCFRWQYFPLPPLSEALLQHGSLMLFEIWRAPAPHPSMAVTFLWQMPCQQSLDGTRQSTHGSVGAIVPVTVKWQQSGDVCISHCLFWYTQQVLLFLAPVCGNQALPSFSNIETLGPQPITLMLMLAFAYCLLFCEVSSLFLILIA